MVRAALIVAFGIAGAVAPLPAQAPKVAPGNYPWTEADVEFITGMISHHAQAIVMARMAPAQASSPSVKTLCARIINSQNDEIDIMQRWLKERGLPVPPAEPRPMKMKMSGVEHEMMMPGMLNEEQMAKLSAANGDEWDRLFLEYMIQHHQGAVTMVEQLNSSPGAGQDHTVFKLSSDVYSDQLAEIDRMEMMLSQIPAR